MDKNNFENWVVAMQGRTKRMITRILEGSPSVVGIAPTFIIPYFPRNRGARGFIAAPHDSHKH
jgi:hypothetical protein